MPLGKDLKGILYLKLGVEYILPAGLGNPSQNMERVVTFSEINGPEKTATTHDGTVVTLDEAREMSLYESPTSAARINAG